MKRVYEANNQEKEVIIDANNDILAFDKWKLVLIY